LTASFSWDLAGATSLASAATGVASAIAYYLLAISAYGPAFIDVASALLMLGIGLGAGMLIIWPICLICAAIGVSLAERHEMVRRWSAWIAVGFGVGAFLLLAWPLSTGDFTAETLAAVSLLGGLPGAFASGLTHKLLGVTV
jgi:hypothetical protein